MTPTTITEAIARIRAIQERVGHDTQDDISAQWMAEAWVEGKPAFAWLCSYHNQKLGTFVAEVACQGSIAAAQDELEDFWKLNKRNPRDLDFLDTLMPLNDAGVRDLMAAYERSGTFRDYAELASRVERYEPALAVAAE